MIPSLADALWEPDTGERWQTGAHAAWVTRDIVLLVGAAVVYLNWRLTASPTMGWYSALLTAVSIHLLCFDLLLLTAGPDSAEFAPDQNPDFLPLVAAPALVVLAVRQTPVPARLNPLALGAAIALLSGGVRMVQVDQVGGLRTLQGEHPWVVASGMVLLGAAACVMMASARAVPVRERIASIAAGAVLVVSHAGAAVTPDGRAHAAVATAGVIGAMGIVVSAVKLCSSAALTIQASSTLLGDQVVQAERRVLRDAEVLHELRATVAGVNKASRLLRRGDSLLPKSHRVKLESMLEHELDRMERLLEHRPETGGRVVDLDDLIDPLVTAQRALGFDVLWEPTGHQVVGSADDLTEAIHILLANAGRHAGDGTTEVSVGREAGNGVVIRVSDTGPGISADVVELLFRRGARSDSSPGEGIGLHVARRLVRDHGGDLLLERTERGGGSTFLMIIPDMGKESAS